MFESTSTLRLHRLCASALVLLALLVISVDRARAEAAVTLDHVDGLYAEGQIKTGEPIKFYLRVTGDQDNHHGVANGFRIYSDYAGWNTTFADTTGTLGKAQFDLIFMIFHHVVTGFDADTVGFMGSHMDSGGMPPGFDDTAYTIEIGPIDPMYAGYGICLDSCFVPPSVTWKWAGVDTVPAWDGPHCYTIVNPDYDLEVTSIVVSDTFPNPDQTPTVTITVRNNGSDTVPANATDLKVWLDEPGLCDWGTIQNPDHTFNNPNPIPSGQQWQKQFQLSLLPGERFNISAEVNYDQTLPETYYGNNCDGPTVVWVDWEVSGQVTYLDWEENFAELYMRFVDVAVYSDGSTTTDTTVMTDEFGEYRAFVTNEVNSVQVSTILGDGYYVEIDIKSDYGLVLDSSEVRISGGGFEGLDVSGHDDFPNKKRDSLFTTGCNAVRAFHQHREFMQEEVSPGWEFAATQFIHIDTVYDSCFVNPFTLDVTLKSYFGDPHPGTVDDRYMQHELAHVVYFQTQPTIFRPGGTHVACIPLPDGLAMSEAWADFVACLIPDQDTLAFYKTSDCVQPGNPKSIESVDFHLWDFNEDYYGNQIQGAVAGLLFDLIDHYTPTYLDDDMFSYSFSSLFNTYSNIPLESGDTLTAISYTRQLLDEGAIPAWDRDLFCILLRSFRFWMFGPAYLQDYCDPTDVELEEVEQDLIPKFFAVRQNYPNPFNGSTNLLLDLPRKSNIGIEVFNILGQSVFNQVFHDLSPGRHTFVLDLPVASSGVYFARVSSDLENKTVKMLYIK